MLKHYLLISWRTIVHRKFYSIILTLGLALGVAAALLLGMYTFHELSYDDFHVKKDRIYLVGVDSKEGVEEYRSGSTTPPTGPALAQHFPEIETQTRICSWLGDVVVTQGDKQFVEPDIMGADSTVFDVFTIPFVAGNPKTALTKPNSIVVTRSVARKYFGHEDVLNQTLHFDHFYNNCVITGVVDDYPLNSHLKFGIIVSLNSFGAVGFDFDNSWTNHTFATYVLLKPGASATAVEERMAPFIRSNLNTYFLKRFNKTFDEMYKAGDHYKLFLAPLRDVHLSTYLEENQEGKKMLVYALALVGVIIVLLVCINYTNLATVLSFGRAREVGIRKVSGSHSSLLFKQFILESILLAFIGLIVGIGFTEVALPFFNTLVGTSLRLDYTNPVLVSGLIGFGVVIGLLSGVYPALTFASFKPVTALKGNVVSKGQHSWLRNGLVTFQFTVCIVMIVSSIVVYKQLSFMTQKNLGFAKEQVLVIKRPEGLKENKMAFKNELLKQAGVHSVSFSETTPGREFNGHGQHIAGTPETDTPVIYPLVADIDILETLDLQVVAGRTFNDSDVKQPRALLNEAAIKQLGIKQPLQTTIDLGTMGRQPVDVVGVVKDFHYRSFHHRVEPLVIFSLDPENDTHHRITLVLVKLNGENIPTLLAGIEKEWKKLAGNYPFEYSFLDDDFNKLFAREALMTKVYTTFSLIAIGIACLGLLGLSSYFTSMRTKEIGIRKVVGASLSNIATMLSYDFIKLVLIAIVVGSCLSAYLMHQWLSEFAFQTPLSWWIFVVAGVIMGVIAMLTVSWHLYKAAARNPVEMLKYE